MCLGIDGVEAEPILLGSRPARRRRALGLVVLERDARAVAGAQAMGVDADRSLRVSVGWSTTDADVDAFAEAFPGIVERLRGLRTA